MKMINLLLLFVVAALSSYLFLVFIFKITEIDTNESLPDNCRYDGDCPCCEHTTIMYESPDEKEVKYWCTRCEWIVTYKKNEDGMWRKL